MRITGTVHSVLEPRRGRTNDRDWEIREVRILDEEDLTTVQLGDSIPSPSVGESVDYGVTAQPRQTRQGWVVQIRATRAHTSRAVRAAS